MTLYVQVMDQYSMTQEMWEERITSYYAQHKGLPRYQNALLIFKSYFVQPWSLKLITCTIMIWENIQ